MSKEHVCTSCGYAGPTVTKTKGHFALEVVLWLAFLIPGLIYSVWRLTTRHEACPGCGNANTLPIEAPMAQKFLKENFPEVLEQKKALARPPSESAKAAGKSLGRMAGRLLSTHKDKAQ